MCTPPKYTQNPDFKMDLLEMSPSSYFFSSFPFHCEIQQRISFPGLRYKPSYLECISTIFLSTSKGSHHYDDKELRQLMFSTLTCSFCNLLLLVLHLNGIFLDRYPVKSLQNSKDRVLFFSGSFTTII